MLKFLFVDDDEDFHKTMKRYAAEKKISLQCLTNGDDAIDKLKSHPNSYDAIILDFNCINKRGEEPNKLFLGQLLIRLAAVDEHLPKAVLSGNPQAKEAQQFQAEKFFQKGEGEIQCFEWLERQAKKSEWTRTKEKFSEVIQIFDQYLQESHKETFLDCIKNAELNNNHSDEIRRKEIINYRSLLNSTLIALSGVENGAGFGDVSKNKFDKLLKQGDIAIAIDMLNQTNPKILSHEAIAFRVAKYINTIVNNQGAHSDEEYNEKSELHGLPPTQHILQMLLHSLCVYLLWFKGWMDENTKK
jgi:CheY-like chemotaxis protein